MKEQIPPILRPEHITPLAIAQIIERFSLELVSGDSNVTVTGISMNTNDLRNGDLFVAMPGLKTHGANFAGKALELGAAAIVTDSAGLELIGQVSVPLIQLEQPRLHLGDLAAFVYGNLPNVMPLMFGTTGTNGKTSTSYILEAILRQLGQVTGLTSTAERHIAGEVIVSRLTTPESTEMQALISRMREAKVTSVAIEVSAQALTQHRIDGIHFDVVGFTNLSHDHLDDYADMGEYLAAKVQLFQPKRAERGVVCLDSAFGEQFAALATIPFVTVATGKEADFVVTVTEEVPARTAFSVRLPDGSTIESWLPIIGAHMASNAGLAIAMLIEAGFTPDRIREAVSGGIHAYLPGRTERVTGATGPDVYVDFGHSPDAFLNTLKAVRKVTRGKVIMLFGADGDRDASKRPAMASVSAENCDILVITDHHPRFEDPASIRKVLVDSARAARPELEIFEVSPPEDAIVKAVSLAAEGDAILWAGPGHQDYRDIRGVRTPYSARALAREALKNAGWS
ncbi:MAG: UDP-N-acetylmuramoyl-L-alanyl-D-glutamate--2,6-diaminopimelate ligase [Rhodoluna sp.]|nr:UDP-N-acetylmuramoyl-L-alanyl-D-glutamate--2,6-diaminopimelate ligase [Rhodoluna sp.]